MKENQKHLYAKNWLIVYYLPTNIRKCLGYFQNMLLWRHFQLPKVFHFLSI